MPPSICVNRMPFKDHYHTNIFRRLAPVNTSFKHCTITTWLTGPLLQPRMSEPASCQYFVSVTDHFSQLLHHNLSQKNARSLSLQLELFAFTPHGVTSSCSVSQMLVNFLLSFLACKLASFSACAPWSFLLLLHTPVACDACPHSHLEPVQHILILTIVMLCANVPTCLLNDNHRNLI